MRRFVPSVRIAYAAVAALLLPTAASHVSLVHCLRRRLRPAFLVNR